MIFQKYKLFWKMHNNGKTIVDLPYSEDEDYYSYLKKWYDQGYRQVIVSSEIMLELISDYVVDKRLIPYEINFAEEDEELVHEINHYLAQLKKKPSIIVKLLNKLRFSCDESSIDMKRIYFKGCIDNFYIAMFIQSNGIIGISQDSYDYFFPEICTRIQRSILG